MAEIVGAADRLDEAMLWQFSRHRMMRKGLTQVLDQTRCDLRHFERMREARAVEIAVAKIEDLRLALQASKEVE